MPILAQQANTLLLIQCHHSGPARMMHDFKLHRLAIGQGQGFNAKLNNPALEY